MINLAKPTHHRARYSRIADIVASSKPHQGRRRAVSLAKFPVNPR